MELALEFFRRLDAELNRVNRFYKLKEEEYTLRAHTLQLQMATLLELRKALARDGGKSPGTGVCVSDAKDENKSGYADTEPTAARSNTIHFMKGTPVIFKFVSWEGMSL